MAETRFFLTEASDLSHNDICRLLARALNPDGEERIWPVEVYDDMVVYDDGGQLYRRSYAIDAEGQVTLGDAVAVERRVEYVAVGAMDEAQQPTDGGAAARQDAQPVDGTLLEAVDADGWDWRVQIIRAGVSANGNEYPLAVLHEAAPVYAGVPVFYGRGPDHNRNERGADAVAGWITAARPNAVGVEGVFEINRGKPDVRESVRHAYDVKRRTGREAIGFSHVIPSGGFISEARRPSGRRVTKILRAESVDLVMNPAAGGSLLGPLAEGVAAPGASEYVFDALQEAIMDVQKLLARLREGRKLSLEELAALNEAVGTQELAEALAESARAGATGQETGAADSGATGEAMAVAGNGELRESLAALEARLREAEQRAALAQAEAVLRERLAESRLPEPLRAAIAADFSGRLFEAAELDARIDRDREIAARLAQVRPTGLGRIEVTTDQRDKFQQAMDGFFGLVRGATPQQDQVQLWLRTPMHFRSLREAFEQITGRRVTDPREILAEAVQYAPRELPDGLRESVTTSTFAEILGDSIRRRMIAQYLMPDLQSFMLLVSEVSGLSDFRTNRRVRLGGYGDLPTVSEGGTYQPLTSPGDEEATYAPAKRGGLEDLTMETIMNDDMQVVRQIPVRLGEAAVRTLRHAIFNTVLRDNPTIYDGVALFHASHGNLGSTALSAAELSVVRRAMRDQMPYGVTTQPLGASNLPRRLFVPAELEEIAFKLSNSAPYVLASNENATTPNIHRGIEYTVVDEWTDANDWVAAADPANTPIIELGFLNGREEPELFVQDAPTVGSVFTADKITYKIRHIWGYAVLDYRGLYKEVVA
jgi:hypothetical protein